MSARPTATQLAAARRILQMIDQDQVPEHVTWQERWNIGLDAMKILIQDMENSNDRS